MNMAKALVILASLVVLWLLVKYLGGVGVVLAIVLVVVLGLFFLPQSTTGWGRPKR
jgi:hypothetical protein